GSPAGSPARPHAASSLEGPTGDSANGSAHGLRLQGRVRASVASGFWVSALFGAAAALGAGLQLAFLRRPPRPTTGPVGSPVVAVTLLHFLVALALASYLRRFGQPRLRLLRTQLGILGMILLVTWAARGLFAAFDVHALWLPVTLAPLWMAASFDRRAGFVVSV